MKILYLIRTMDVGGAERFTYNLAAHFSNRFEKVAIYCSPGIFVEELESRHIKFFPSRFAKRRGLRFTIRMFFELKNILNCESFDIIHCQQRIFLILVNLIYANKNRPRIIYTANNFFEDFVQRLLRADRLIGVSPAITNNLMNTCPNQRAKICNINYGVVPQKTLKGNQSPSFRLGFVGRIVREKGVFNIFNAVKDAIISNPNIKLYFIGDGKEKNNLVKLVRRHSLEKIITILNTESDLKKLYHNLDLLLLPTEMSEGLPISILEAASFGIPTLAVDSGGIKDFIVDGVTGYFIDSPDYKNISNKISEIINNQSLHATIKNNCIEKVHSEFSLQYMLRKYEIIYLGH